METEQYFTEYEEFMNKYKLTEVSAEETGVLAMRMAYYYATMNNRLASATRALALVAASIHGQSDPVTSKAITSSKAEVITDATDESDRYRQAKTHVANTEQMLNALKSLQRGLQNEYANSV